MNTQALVLGVASLAAFIGALAVGLPWGATTLLLAVALTVVVFLEFEASHANSRSIALLAVVVALAVVSRQAMHAVGVSPVFYFIVLAGYVFGGVYGFVCGAAVLGVSNFMVAGHGPWSPYQMIAAGLVGFLAAFVPRRGGIVLLAVYGFLSAFLYGAVTDVFWWQQFAREHTWTTYLAIHMAGLPVNLARAAGNLLLIGFLGPPALKVLRRFRLRLTVEYVD